MSTTKRVIAAVIIAGLTAALTGCFFPPPPGDLVPDVPAPHAPGPGRHIPGPP